MTRPYKKLTNYVKNLSWKLFLVILFWCALGVGGVYGAWILWSKVGLTDSSSHVTASLAVVGGVGGVVALVIAFRKQSAVERGEGQDRLNDAVRLLGDSQPSTRIAGVYAVIAAGKRHSDLREQAADILCGYLRTARPADDAPVESTIIHRLRDVLRKDAPDRWQHIDIDVHGAAITAPFELNSSVIATADFSQATFKGLVALDGAEFENFALFQKSTFMESVAIKDAAFHGGADFSQSEFHGIVNFRNSKFLLRKAKPEIENRDQCTPDIPNRVFFYGVHFHALAVFNRTQFYTDCIFSRMGYHLSEGRYETVKTSFDIASFRETKFLAHGTFNDVEFNNLVFHNDAEFCYSYEEAQFNKLVAAAR